MALQVHDLRTRLAAVLKEVGVRGRCRYCGADLFIVYAYPSNSLRAYDIDGRSHLPCAAAKETKHGG